MFPFKSNSLRWLKMPEFLPVCLTFSSIMCVSYPGCASPVAMVMGVFLQFASSLSPFWIRQAFVFKSIISCMAVGSYSYWTLNYLMLTSCMFWVLMLSSSCSRPMFLVLVCTCLSPVFIFSASPFILKVMFCLPLWDLLDMSDMCLVCPIPVCLVFSMLLAHSNPRAPVFLPSDYPMCFVFVRFFCVLLFALLGFWTDVGLLSVPCVDLFARLDWLPGLDPRLSVVLWV